MVVYQKKRLQTFFGARMFDEMIQEFRKLVGCHPPTAVCIPTNKERINVKELLDTLLKFKYL